MANTLSPLGDRVVIEAAEQEDKTASGIYIPDTAKEKPQEGKVIAVGPGALNKEGARVPMEVHVGDVVLYSKYAGTEVRQGLKDVLVVNERDILAILKK